MKVFVIDHARCNGCYNCQIACKDEHVGNDWSPVARPQPQTGHFWIGVKETTRGSIPRVRVTYEPSLCQHCDEAPCIKAAPDAVHKRADGLVIIDPEKAAGRREIVESCPYGSIHWNEELSLAQKCTGCAHLLDQGWSEPRCVEVCPTGALLFGEEEDLADKVACATVLHPELATSPRVYQLGMPGRFVAGGVWDPAEDEIIEGARLSLAGPGGEEYLVETDGFGDFWFEDLAEGQYTLTVEADGFRSETITSICTDADVNVGDIALQAEGVRA